MSDSERLACAEAFVRRAAIYLNVQAGDQAIGKAARKAARSLPPFSPVARPAPTVR